MKPIKILFTFTLYIVHNTHFFCLSGLSSATNVIFMKATYLGMLIDWVGSLHEHYPAMILLDPAM